MDEDATPSDSSAVTVTGNVMDKARTTHLSKFLSLVLRHQPSAANVTLDAEGWVDAEVLLAGAARAGVRMTQVELREVVYSSDKQRFALSEDGKRIRANQGHSVAVDLGLTPTAPPEVLFHGTVEDAIQSIMTSGLEKRARHHVHLSADVATARKVGSRRGPPVLLTVDARAMSEAGHAFYVSDNGVWLTDAVPPKFLSRL